jgi:hypothetical protein
LFPKLPAAPAPRPAPTTAPAPREGPGPATSPGLSAAPAVSAHTQRVTVVSLEPGSGGTVLRARDEGGNELAFDIATYTRALRADGGRAEVDDLRSAQEIEVTWFPHSDRRALLTIRQVR